VVSLDQVFIIYTFTRIGPLIHVPMVITRQFSFEKITSQGEIDAREFIIPNAKMVGDCEQNHKKFQSPVSDFHLVVDEALQGFDLEN
jgi:hypothetical protein